MIYITPQSILMKVVPRHCFSICENLNLVKITPYMHDITRTVCVIEMADGGELSAEHLELRLIQSNKRI